MSGLFGIFTGFFLVIGYQLEMLDKVDLSDKNAMYAMLGLMIVITIDTRYVWRNYEQAHLGKKLFGLFTLVTASPEDTSDKKILFTREHLSKWGILAALGLVVLLAEYPGFFVYDAQEELNEVLTRTFTTHHPLLHVLLLGGTIALFHKITGSWNLGIFSYIFLQMLVITCIFAYVITYMQKRGIGKKSRIIWTIYYGVFPTIVMYTLCSSKDGLFSSLLLLLTALLIQLINNPKGYLASRCKVIAFIVVACLMPCFRHNGFYAYLVFIPFTLIFFIKKLSKVLISMLIAPVILYLLITTTLSLALASSTPHHQEMLTVPIMQMARVYTYDKDSLSLEDINTLKAYIPEENLNKYTPRVSDLVKVGFNNELYEQNKTDFWKLWFKLFKSHPMTYVNAWLLTSYGYWYPPANINVYKGTTVYTFTYDESSYFGYEVELPGERHSFIPAIDSFYRYISIGPFHNDFPILALIFSPGLLIIIYLYILAYRLYKRDYKNIFPFLLILLVWLTVILGPTYLVRYVVILWLALPLLLVTGSTKI
ncbi:MAG: hypothetical protein J6O61_12405 [Butyrivibrio sp.]|uniref:DUF6020 family protein n=1 Tax=Butyrivibrio sp. TaxID=28121 RepID=UPI001AFCE73E|nr:DUF6020 family protein [Butyrivibrio sp.]MBO6241620.1 hypothetical protein [Butyrivibrio sp.]